MLTIGLLEKKKTCTNVDQNQDGLVNFPQSVHLMTIDYHDQYS